eukprot:COSAG02_NODE_6149_length_3767_cov_1.609051_5_plen_74_part_00
MRARGGVCALLLLAGTQVDLDGAAVPAAASGSDHKSDNPAGSSALPEKSALFDLRSGPTVTYTLISHWFLVSL